MSVLKIKNTPYGAWQPIASIKGEKGDTGPAGGNVTDAVKLALLQIANHVYYDNDQGPTYIQNLQDALFPPADIVSITAVYTQSGPVYNTDDIDDLKTDLVVTANKTGGTTQTIAAANYTLFGELTVGTSTISVVYRGYTTTFDVAVTREPNGLVDGTYSPVSGSGTLTISSNAITGSGVTSSFVNFYVPLQHPINLKAGDVVTFTPTNIIMETTHTGGVYIDINNNLLGGTVYINPFRATPLSKTFTMPVDAVAERFKISGAPMDNRTFTLGMSVNGEVIF